MTCGECLFFEWYDSWVRNGERIVQGCCRRFPPIYQGEHSENDFAVVESNDWCGEFKKREDEQ